jgi:tetratricopeptide (TPR) repeat protein
MKTIDFSYFVERYNAGEMSDAEKLWFQKELEGNEKLRNEVFLRKTTDKILRDQNVISLRNKLSAIEKKRMPVSPVKKTNRPAYLKYAAVITVFVIFGSIMLYPGKNQSSEEILSRYYKVYEPATSQRSGTFARNQDFTLALEYYNTHDYEKAAKLFSKIVESNPKDMQSTLLNGISNFESNRYPDAKQSFGTVIDNKNNLFIDQAKWYLALCYIKTDDKIKAIQQLEIIRKEGSIYKNDAKKILRRLK